MVQQDLYVIPTLVVEGNVEASDLVFLRHAKADNGVDDFQDDEGASIIDTVETIVYPPENSIENMRAHATREFTADDMISFANGTRDTLIMTEIEFAEEQRYMVLDETTLRNLEVTHTMAGDK